jgi:hypothetical protein
MKLDPTLAALKLRNDQLRAENDRLQKALDQDDQDSVVILRQFRAENERLRSLLRQCIPSLQRDGRPHVVGMVQAALGDIVTVAADQPQAATSPAHSPDNDSKSPQPRST